MPDRASLQPLCREDEFSPPDTPDFPRFAGVRYRDFVAAAVSEARVRQALAELAD